MPSQAVRAAAQVDETPGYRSAKGHSCGHYQRKLHIKAGEATLKMPKLRQLRFETAIIERYRRRKSLVEEALIEMYLAGVSVPRVEDASSAASQMVSPH